MKVIPHPQLMVRNEGIFSINSATFLYADKQLLGAADFFNSLLEKCVGYRLTDGNGGISFVLEPSFEPERYKIVIAPSILTVYCADLQAANYAVQTLRQLLELDLPHTRFCNVNCGIIDDSPRYNYRGVSLDIVRHWFGKEHIISFIDQIARLKFNYLHLHFSDDQGYRIESTAFPKLNSIGSFREKTSVRNTDFPSKYQQEKYGGFLTKTEVKGIVAYAQKLGITIIPELDLPGHSVAAISAYPALSCRNEQIPVRCEWGISKDILCAGSDTVYAFLCTLIDEICELFPSPYFHIGGDEAPKTRWKRCPKCHKKMQDIGAKNYSQLHAYMVNYFAKYLAGKGKKTIVWNDCLSEELESNVIVQHWTAPLLRSNKPTIEHINNGRSTIMSYFTATYLDYPYSMTPLRTVYEFNPALKGVKAKENIIGMECNIWCEHIRTREKFDFNVFPRIVAFAENAWSSRKNYDDFCIRLADYYKLLDSCGVKYAKNMEEQGKNFSTTRKFFTTDADIEIKQKRIRL